ncbi:NADH-quinone oxidoreductase subunit J family protein [Flammeovirga pacifica]|uniref:NADH-quinone oxidoreductase subunit J n=1 Tax=Flammeovirga pacifica TaxID=915059 RepID=A0A1S1YWT5_FLAPC|nr:NADH-quinone oxidoreductase subunit J [Flammeovirga pacifica]OHX65472.1 hypothetical protein NH26_03470 [Flammeovirga pacifica]
MIVYIFYFLVAVMSISSIALFFTKKVIYNAAYLLFALLSVAGLFVISASDFLAITQVMIYIGGVLVLLLFGIMYTKNKDDEGVISGSKRTGLGLVLGGLSFGLLANSILQEEMIVIASVPDQSVVNILGVQMMTNHIFSFELTAILLLVVLIGAVFITTKSEKKIDHK